MKWVNRQTSNTSRTLVGIIGAVLSKNTNKNKIIHLSDLVGAPTVGAAPITSLFSI